MAEELHFQPFAGRTGKWGKVVRLVFFTFCEDNQEYQFPTVFFWNNGWTSFRFSPSGSFACSPKSLWWENWCWEVHSLPATAGEDRTVEEEQMVSSVRYLPIGYFRSLREIIAEDSMPMIWLFLSANSRSRVFGKVGRNSENRTDELRWYCPPVELSGTHHGY